MKKLLSTSLSLLIATIAIGQTLTDAISYTVTGTYTFTVPNCVSEIKVEAWGAGGGGGGAEDLASARNEAGGGGGGGAFSRTNSIPVTPGEVYTIYVGAGGAGGTTAPTDGQDGEASYFENAAGTKLVLANGGSGGSRSNALDYNGVLNPVINVANLNTGARNPTDDPNGEALNINAGGAGGSTVGAIGDDVYSGGNGGAGFLNDYNPHGIGGGGGGSAGRSENGGDGKIGYIHCYEGYTCKLGSGAPAGGAGPAGGVEGGSGHNEFGMPAGVGPATDGQPGGGGGGGSTNREPGANGGDGKVIVYWGRYSTYNATTTWTAPAGITSVEVEVWGAGGGGGGYIDWSSGAGGGGGGAYSKAIVSVVPGQTYTLNIGEGGSAGLGLDLENQSDGGDGGDTWFGDLATTQVLAKGGKGGQQGVEGSDALGGAGGSAAQSIAGPGFIAYSGGNGGKGKDNIWGAGGGGGSSAGYAADGGDGGDAGNQAAGVRGIAPAGGYNGATGASTYQFGQDASGYGAGGGGAANGGPGARGSNGQMILGYFPSVDISNNGAAVNANNICAGATDILMHSFIISGNNAEQCNKNVVTDVRMVTAGTYLATDIANYKLYVTTTNTFSTANLLATISAPAAAGTQTFPTFPAYDLGSNVNYFWVTMDLTNTAGGNRTINANASTDTEATTTPAVRVNAAGYGAASATQTFVNAPTLSSTLTPPSICSGGTFNYTPTSTTAGASFTWSRATITDIAEAGTSSTNGVSETLSNSSTSAINVTYAYTSSANGCSTTEDVIVAVGAVPSGELIGPAQACLNDPTLPEIKFVGKQGSTNYTFTYDINGVVQPTITSAGSDTATITAANNVAGITTYNLISVQEGSVNACSGTVNGVSTTVDIKPPADGTLSAAVTRVCVGAASPDITFTGSNGVAPYSFTYTVDSLVNGNYVGVTSYSVQAAANVANDPVPTNNADTLRYIITGVADNSGLVCQAAPDTILMIVDPLPLSTITSPLGANQCFGQPGGIQLDFNAINVVGQVTFNYTEQYGIDSLAAVAAVKTPVGGYDLGPLSLGKMDTTIFIAAGQVGTTIYSNGVSQSNVCTGSGFGSASITIHPLPTASITGNNTICETGSTIITFTGADGTAPYTFTYDINGGTSKTISTTGTQNSVDLIVSDTPGSYTFNLLAVSDKYSCNQAQTGNAVVVIENLPTASTSGNSDAMCINGNQNILGATFSDGTSVWTHNGNGILNNATTITPDYSPGVGDDGTVLTFTLTVTSDNSCGTATATATHQIRVDSLPLAIAGGSNTICENASVNVNGALASYGDIAWTHNGGGTLVNDNTTSPTYTASSTDAGNAVVLTMAVTSTNSCSPAIASATHTLNIDALPTATAGNSQSICENASATVNGASLSNGTPDWSHNGAGSFNGTNNSLTPTYTASASDKGNEVILTLTVTSNNTCTGATTTATDTLQIDPLPTATVGNNVSICENGSTTITGAAANNGSILWTDNGNGTLTNETSTSPTYAANSSDAGNAVILTMTVTSNNSCGNQTAVKTTTLTIDPLPTSTAGGTQTICENASAIISGATQTNGSPRWIISSGSGSLSNANSLTPSYTATSADRGNTVILNMIVTSTNSCAPQSDTAMYTINVDKLPTAVSGNSTTICAEALYTLKTGEASATDGTITWTENGLGTISGNNETPTYTSSIGDAGNPVTLTMIVASNNTCGAAKDSANFLVNVRPLMDAQITTSSPTACEGDPLQIIFTASNGRSLPYTISYTVDGGSPLTISTIGNNRVTVIGANTNNVDSLKYRIVNVSDGDCSNAISGAIKTVTVNPLPKASIIGNDEVCQDSLVSDIVFKAYNATAPYQITYSVNNSLAPSIQTNSGDSIALSVNSNKVGTNTYKLISVKDALGCSTKANGTAEIIVINNPLAEFTLEDNNASILEPYVDIYESSLHAVSWNWNFGDGTTSNSPDPEYHQYTDSGVYYINLVVANKFGCTDSIMRPVNISMPALVFAPSAFTPNNDGLNDTFLPKGDGIGEYELKIYDRWGNLIFVSNDINEGWDGTANGGSEVAQLDSYVYAINVKAIENNHSFTYRGVVQLVR